MAKSLLAGNNLTAAQRYSKNGKIVQKGAKNLLCRGCLLKNTFNFQLSIVNYQLICIFAAGNF